VSGPTTLYRFKIELSDVERNLYQSLDFRVSQHPSESLPFLLTRALAFVLNAQDGLAFSPKGLSDPDEACLSIPDSQGGIQLWIEVGNPSTRKLHRASKAAKLTKVYTYKNALHLINDILTAKVHNAQKIEIYSFAPILMDQLEAILEKENRWSILVNDGLINISTSATTVSGEILKHPVKEKLI
jgi:uncharacterized protein YaeQ